MSLNNVDNGFEQANSGADNAPFIGGQLVPTQVSFSIAAGASNIAEITIQIQDGHGAIIPASIPFLLWLSDSSDGEGLVATEPTGGVIAKIGDFGKVFADFSVTAPSSAKSVRLVQPKTDGAFVLSILDTAKGTIFIAVQNIFGGRTSVSAQLKTADYGA